MTEVELLTALVDLHAQQIELLQWQLYHLKTIALSTGVAAGLLLALLFVRALLSKTIIT